MDSSAEAAVLATAEMIKLKMIEKIVGDFEMPVVLNSGDSLE